MAKTKQKAKYINTSDGAYFLKLVIVLILGSIWLKVSNGSSWQLPLPIGMIAGLIFIGHERLKNDRKIQYGILLAAMLVGFWAPIGLFIRF